MYIYIYMEREREREREILITFSYMYICKSRHEPIGVRGFLRVWGRFFKILGRRERTKEEKQM